jgi:DNA-binding CsgD family transcriptional regulator
MLPVVTIEAELAREARDFARARAAALEAADAPKDDPGVLRYLWPLVWTGVRAEAERCAADGDVLDPELLDLASTMGSPSLPTAAYRDLTLAETAGVADPAPWAAAVAAWRPVGWPWQLGYALLRLAEAYAESRALDAAGEALTEAMQIAGRLDAEPLLGRGRQLAQRARLGLDTATQSTQATPPDADDPLARYGLTAREHEVLLLLAAGHSNAQIASRLFISPKTARVHVSNLLGKLGVESRVQAAGVAHRLGIDV